MLRTPAWLADYRCGRTMVCCHAPWRAVVLPGEIPRIDAHLASTAAPDTLRAAFRAAVVPRGETTVLRQPGGRCTLLDPATAACTLHATAGLDALSAACRNFPRSVVATPDAVEVAFTPACPTVARTLLDATGRFSWHIATAAASPFPARQTAPAALPLTRGHDLDFAALSSLREAWWDRLAGAATRGPDLVATLAALHGTPTDPDAASVLAPSLAPLLPPFGADALGLATAVLTALPARGPAYRAAPRALWGLFAALDAPPAAPRARALTAVAAVAALGVQSAAVHDDRTVAAGFRAAASRALLVLHLAPRLADAFALDPDDALVDALVVSANLIAPT